MHEMSSNYKGYQEEQHRLPETEQSSSQRCNWRPDGFIRVYRLCLRGAGNSDRLYLCRFFFLDRRRRVGSRRVNDPAFSVPRFTLPTGLEQLTELKARKSMRFSVEDDLVEGQDVVGPEEKVEILERFSLEGDCKLQ